MDATVGTVHVLAVTISGKQAHCPTGWRPMSRGEMQCKEAYGGPVQGTNIQRGNAVQGGVWGTCAGDKYPLNEQVATNATKVTRTPVDMERYLTFFLMCLR